MKEYIVNAEEECLFYKHDELIRCKDCEGYEEGRCHWWYDEPEVPPYGYCYQAEVKEGDWILWDLLISMIFSKN